MPSLTRVEAAERAGLLTVDGYAIDLDLTNSERTFRSRTTVRFRSAVTGASSWLDVKALRLQSAVLNGAALDTSTWRDGRLPLPDLAERNELVVSAEMAYSNDGEGMHRQVDPADGRAYLHTMSFLDAAPRWFACFDQPDLKAAFVVSVRCPDDWTVAGNGPAIRATDGTWRLTQPRPIATYLAALVAGPYRSVRSEHDGIPLALHARASLAAYLERDADELFSLTAGYLDEYHRLFGVRYPWGEYHHAFVSDANAGAMENPGCVVYQDTLLFRSRAIDSERGQRASTMAHEMAHMWFGDLVTMRWWDELWLNESFAEYLGYRVCDATTADESWVRFGIARKSWGFAADRRPSTHPVAGNGAPDAASALSDFDGISYAKGASVLRQLAGYLGDEVFLAGLRGYFAEHAYGNADLGDLLRAFTAAGAHDLPAWAGQWLRTAGLDTLHAVPSGGSLVVHRAAPPDRPAERSHAVTVTAYAGGRPVASERVVLAAESTAVDLGVAADRLDLVLPDAHDETWARIALPGPAWERLPGLLPGLAPLARVSVWNALRLAVADAEVDPRLATRILVAGLHAEPHDAVISDLLRWAARMLGAYLADPAPEAAQLAALSLRIASGSPAGGGRQLAGARGVAAFASDVELLRSWLAGTGIPDGLVVDAELRCALLERLAELGALTAADVDAEADADRTAQGGLHAAGCHASRPDPTAKEAAWSALMSDPDRPNSELYAIAAAFWRPAQVELTAPYAARYFAELPDLARLRSGWLLARLAGAGYPWTAVDAGTLAAGERLLATELEPTVRRALVDASDDLRRAYTSRQKFG